MSKFYKPKTESYSESDKPQKGFQQSGEKGIYSGGRQIGASDYKPKRSQPQKEKVEEGMYYADRQIGAQNNDQQRKQYKPKNTKSSKQFVAYEAKGETTDPQSRTMTSKQGSQHPNPTALADDQIKQILDITKIPPVSTDSSQFNSSKPDPFASFFNTGSKKIPTEPSTADSESALVSSENLFEGYDEISPEQFKTEDSVMQSSEADSPDGTTNNRPQKKKRSQRGKYLKYFKNDTDVETYHKIRDFWSKLMDATDGDEDKSYRIALKSGIYFENDFLMKACLLVVLVEDEILYLADDLRYSHQKITAIPAAREAVKQLGGDKHKFYKEENGLKQKPKYLSLETFRLAENDIYLINRFDYQTKDGYTMTAFTKLKDEDFISVTTQINPFQNEYASVLQIATTNSVFVFDLIALCSTKDKATALVDNLVDLFKNSKAYLVTYEGTELLMNLVKSMFIENEYQQKDYVVRKTELCRLLEANEHRILNIADYMPGKTFDQIIQEACGAKLNREFEYADWVYRPLKQDMLEYAAVKAYAQLMAFKSIVSNIEFP